ncbi:DNA-3-methyladenine glycosylase [Oscillospiraceae bacterium WX1]
MIIPRDFYEQDTLTVAQSLLGQLLVRHTPAGTVTGIIVETEAYLGEKDDAAHSYRGKTARTSVQYGEKGHAYIYMIYGIHFCLNLTAGPPGLPEVVLIRAVEPVSGIELMAERRASKNRLALCSGPGKLCRAFDIGKELYGADVCQSGALYLVYSGQAVSVTASSRVGIDYAVSSREMPWRFTISDNSYISKPTVEKKQKL